MPFDAAPQELAEWQKNALALADYVEQSKSFDMRRVKHPCGTPACVLGHAWELWGHGASMLNMDMATRAGRDTYNAMFWPNQDDGLYFGTTHITSKMAAAMLRRYAATGEVRYERGDA